MKNKAYLLEFQEGHQFRTEPDPWIIEAKNNAGAISISGDMLGIKGSMTKRKLYNKGGKCITRNGKVIFP